MLLVCVQNSYLSLTTLPALAVHALSGRLRRSAIADAITGRYGNKFDGTGPKHWSREVRVG
ncbi:hypothetical protein SAMN04489740_0490 [Arthrobacter alpinus]|uniref:Uncharacterized protein n=1 Tax=Arthrobacter alpinus TaxID=656366 RepID=A0A1H5FEL4_9MICC|nr:hypothetical protein SAMN04489740_0490 [Arthrobacter alpinus]